jgi:hypothetical protein
VVVVRLVVAVVVRVVVAVVVGLGRRLVADSSGGVGLTITIWLVFLRHESSVELAAAAQSCQWSRQPLR